MAAMRILVATCICLSSLVWGRPQSSHSLGYDPNYPEEVPGLFEGDIDNDPTEIATLRNSVRDHRSLWPNGIVYYEIGAPHSSNPSRVQLFKDAMQYITDKTMVNGKTCVQFKPRTSQTAYIRFVEGDGCHTHIGYAGREKDLTLSDGCYSKGRVMHELLHTLGFWHEQSRYDRDNYVRIHMDNVQSGHEHNFLIHDQSEMDLLNEPYDYDSVMHYSAHSFARDRSKVTIEVLQPGVTIGQRTHLSDIDIEEIKIRYGCIPPKTAVSTGSQTGPTQAPDVHVTHQTGAPGTFPSNQAATCTFENGLCGWTQSTTDSLDWTTYHGKTPSHNTGPDFDHTSLSTSGNYLYLEASSHSDRSAQLVSPLYSSGHYCFSAYYHMYGVDTGTLSFQVLQHGLSHTMKSFRGNLGNHWNHVRMEMNVHHHFQIVIEGDTGHGYMSDIGLDDLSVTPGHC